MSGNAKKLVLYYTKLVVLDKIKYKETSTKCAILFVGHTNFANSGSSDHAFR